MFYNEDRVLIAVMNNRRDLEIARDQGWYRIPVNHAPPSVAEAVVLAFYFTRAFGDEKWAIHWYAAIRGHELVRRRDLLPAAPDHPRAEEPYYKLQISPLIRREPPIPSLRWRRITFLESSWDRFLAAEEINDLYVAGDDGLFVTLKEAGFWPEREFEVLEGGVAYTVDLAIPCQQGTLAIRLGDRPGPPTALRNPSLASIYRRVKELGGERRDPAGV
ncbi:MAG: hypothetical protein JW900_11400 [Anaerolineae bacterium]|nr:hypothetical protein [Anaerolineae bacterium]